MRASCLCIISLIDRFRLTATTIFIHLTTTFYTLINPKWAVSISHDVWVAWPLSFKSIICKYYRVEIELRFSFIAFVSYCFGSYFDILKSKLLKLSRIDKITFIKRLLKKGGGFQFRCLFLSLSLDFSMDRFGNFHLPLNGGFRQNNVFNHADWLFGAITTFFKSSSFSLEALL